MFDSFWLPGKFLKFNGTVKPSFLFHLCAILCMKSTYMNQIKNQQLFFFKISYVPMPNCSMLARKESLTEMMTAETGTYRWMAPEVLNTQ